MPFMKGSGAIRRTIQYLESGDIILRENIKILAFGFNPGKRFEHHHGLYQFVFWHLPQLKYMNPKKHYVTFKKMTPTPWIKAYLDDDRTVLIDCDSRSREDIHDHVKLVLGQSDEQIYAAEQLIQARTANPANFGHTFKRECMCEVPGQHPCPGWKPTPKEMTGKYKLQKWLERKQASS